MSTFEQEEKDIDLNDGTKSSKPVFKSEITMEEVRNEHKMNEPEPFDYKSQIIATLIVVASAGFAILTGILLSNNNAGPDLVSWIGLPGNLFIRSLTCVVLPMIFVNVILAVIQMIEAGKAGAVGKYTIILYLSTTVLAATVGMIFVTIFKNQFSVLEFEPVETFILLECPKKLGFITVNENQSLFCSEEADLLSNFELIDPNYFLEKVSSGPIDTFTFSQTLQDGIFRKFVPSNIVAEFANGGFLGVIMFGVVFGVASQNLTKKPVLIIEFLEDVNDILTKIISWVILLTPIAVFSLISSTLAGEADLQRTLNDVRVLLISSFVAYATYATLIYPLVFFLVTKTNPYKYMRYIAPAQIFALSSSSSAATLPVTLRCVKESGMVPDVIRNFVLPIGATINMDGTGLYFPPALVYLAIAGGKEDQLDIPTYFLLVVVGTLGSAGTAPVPTASLVTLITAFNTVFNSTGTPENFGIIIGIDFLMARLQTVVNVTGDALVARIVTILTKSEDSLMMASHVPEGEASV
eukprot:maker-scaffold_35-snap-gene-0.42-mRNA-1 protein AED:0.04 eAED:0.04 QI:0/0/0/1/1/1/2/0/523